MPHEILGAVSFPSGRAIVVDPIFLTHPDYGRRLAVVVEDVPRAGVYDVIGERFGSGQWVGNWRWAAVEFAAGVAIASSKEVGVTPTDSGRMVFADAVALEWWRDQRCREELGECMSRQALWNPRRSRVLDLDGARVCGFLIIPVDGCPRICRDLAADGSLVRLRVQLAKG